MTHGNCSVDAGGGRLHFGSFRFENSHLAPVNGLILNVEPNRRAGAVGVSDGGLELATGVEAALVGRAQVEAGLKRGTFTVFGATGNGTKYRLRFTGNWNCRVLIKE
jgi:hypothetical protein